MEFTADTIIAIIGLFIGGGGGAFFTWRYQKKKAKAEARQAEAEAEKAKFEAMQANAQLIKDIQGSYQQLATDLKANLDTQQEYNAEQKQYIAELKEDRQHLREERDELRKRLDALTRSVNEWKTDSDTRIRSLQAQVARNQQLVECMRPFLCGRDDCHLRMPLAITSTGGIIAQNKDIDIPPYNDKD